MTDEGRQTKRRSVKNAKIATSSRKENVPPATVRRNNARPQQEAPAPETIRDPKQRQRAYRKQATQYKRQYKPVKQRTHLGIVQLLVLLLVLAVAAAMVFFSWNRWFRYDDTTDIQGQWAYTSGNTELVVNIDGNRIRITPDVAYNYSINAWEKTISFDFANLSGGASYRFSEDRRTVLICEKAEEDWLTDIKILLNMEPITTGFDPEATITMKKISDSVGELPESNEAALAAGEGTEGGATSEGEPNPDTEGNAETGAEGENASSVVDPESGSVDGSA